MNKELWEKILNFKINNPEDEYGFTTRLAIENSWTSYFANTAIIEYKKFIYLAANYNEMVSPSEIVDIVWHQHLIFTSSYDALCKIVSKKIDHIPSTHSDAEKEKFEKARIRTKELYEINFGPQPIEFWNFKSDLESFQVKGSNSNTVFKLGVFLIIPFSIYYLLEPILITIKNPNFLIYYLLLCCLSFFVLDFAIRRSFKIFLEKIKSGNIISNLTPFELIYLQKGNMIYAIHGIINNLIDNKKITVLKNNRLQVIDKDFTDNQYENCVIGIMKEYEPMPYPQLLKIVKEKPIFKQMEKAIDKIKDHIINSQKFQYLYWAAVICMSVILSIGVSRLVLGFSNGRPISYITVVVFGLIMGVIYYAKKIKFYLFNKSIPNFYKNEVLNAEHKQEWEWNYFVLGNVLLLSSFVPLTNYTNRHNSGSGTSCGTSSGSSCGSSCGGGGCGGCGGGH